MTKYREDDINLLLPSMQKHVQFVLDALRADKYRPVLFDSYRPPEEALANAAKGTGIVKSMHSYRSAADIICEKHGWSCRAKKCKFYQTLKRHALSLGFVCGADFSSVDEPHIQCVFVSDQNAVREARDDEEREILAQRFFALRQAALQLKAGATLERVIAFQTAASLIADGQNGPRTQAALKRALRPF